MWYCIVSNMRNFDMDVVHLVYISVYQSVIQSEYQLYIHLLTSHHLDKVISKHVIRIIRTHEPKNERTRKHLIRRYIIQFYWSSLQFSHRPPFQHWTGDYLPPFPSHPFSSFLHISNTIYRFKVAMDRAFNIVPCTYHNLTVTLHIW